jgi:CelD/BcsL family acetyltransferase involved in cellulose biosynthesis
MIRHLLDNEHVARIDFGRGDDVYKQGWAGQRQQRIGLLLVNPWHLVGMTTLVRHTVGRVRHSLRSRGLRQQLLRAAPTEARQGREAHAHQGDGCGFRGQR